MVQCHLHHLYSHHLYSVSCSVDGIDLDVRLREVAVADGVGEVTEGEIAVIVVVAAGDSVHRRGNLVCAAGQNWLGWAVGPNFVSCGGSGGPVRDNLVRYFLEGGDMLYMDL